MAVGADEANLEKLCDPLLAKIGKLSVDLDRLRKKVKTTRSVRERRGLLEKENLPLAGPCGGCDSDLPVQMRDVQHKRIRQTQPR